MVSEMGWVCIMFSIIAIAFLSCIAITQTNQSNIDKCLERCSMQSLAEQPLCYDSCKLLRSEFTITSNQNNTYMHGYITNEMIKQLGN